MEDKNQNQSKSSGVGLLFLIIGAMLVGLKTTGVINWAWWIVLMPFYPTALVISMGLLLVFGIGLVAVVAAVLKIALKSIKSK